MLAIVRPRDLAGKTGRRMAAEELADLHRLDTKHKAMRAELKTAVQATAPNLMDIPAIGPADTARILAQVGDVARFPKPQPLRILDRRRADRRLQRPASALRAVARREPPPQPRPL